MQIRSIAAEDFADWAAAMSAVFMVPAPGPAELELRRAGIDLTRAVGAYEGDCVVATYRSFATTTTTPGGGTVTTDAISNVTVQPTHRRRGLLTRMIGADLRAAADRGEALALLVAAEWPIYGRYGFGPAVARAAYRIDPRSVRWPAAATDGGSVRFAESAHVADDVRAVHDAVRLQCPGSIERSERTHLLTLGLVPEGFFGRWAGRLAVHRDVTGAADGYVRWHTDSTWDGMTPRTELQVDELLAATPEAYSRLWRLVFGVDLVTAVEADARPATEVLPLLLTDGRAWRQVRCEDFVWARPLDVVAALEARRCPTQGRLVFEVTDADGLASGRYALEGGPDGASCRRTTESADLTLPVSSLGAAYFGGTRVHSLAAAGLVDEHTAGAVLRADALLGPIDTPWALTFF